MFTFIMCIGPIGVLPTINKGKWTSASKPAFMYWDFWKKKKNDRHTKWIQKIAKLCLQACSLQKPLMCIEMGRFSRQDRNPDCLVKCVRINALTLSILASLEVWFLLAQNSRFFTLWRKVGSGDSHYQGVGNWCWNHRLFFFVHFKYHPSDAWWWFTVKVLRNW